MHYNRLVQNGGRFLNVLPKFVQDRAKKKQSFIYRKNCAENFSYDFFVSIRVDNVRIFFSANKWNECFDFFIILAIYLLIIDKQAKMILRENW